MDVELFEPAAYSLPDLTFLADNLGKPPAVVFHKGIPPNAGIIKVRVERLLRTVYELEELHKAEPAFSWAGLDAVQESIARFLEWHARSETVRSHGVKDAAGALITHPSMYAWDPDGRAFKFAIDADAAEMVRTEILDDGSRRPFGVQLNQPSGMVRPPLHEIAPWVKSPAESKARALDAIVEEQKNKGLGVLRCTVCDHTEEFDPRNRQTKGAARARMGRHLRKSTVSVNQHRAVLSRWNR